ncbi:MAG: aminotransferase class I/II-fold pyridoxal phosphate-dependent enzyme, partial [Polyangiaceae bacterium]|nr:aminotransferase class I/II-fold pyridoxal phosphate-dependent enzyme [Polyangiaceae bacterium]
KAVADFITRRDNIPSDPSRILLTDGASKAAQAVMTALLRNDNDAFMIPIPQYPLYSATLALYGGRQVGYLLDESSEWSLRQDTLIAAFDKATAESNHVVCIVVINPGNPTGAVLSRSNIEMILQFAKERHIAVIADEVYQENVYHPEREFCSFAKVLHDLGDTETPLFSLHSISKGFLGECGHRGGYLEMRNVPDDVLEQFIKLQSISLCSNVPGQIATYVMVSPPEHGQPSHETYVRERDALLADLAIKAAILGEGINKIPGMSVDIPQGAMYAFVRFELPNDRNANIEAMSESERDVYLAKRDNDYCMAMLEQTGICVVPGSGFGQAPGTFHFRTTFLPPKNDIEGLVEKLGDFHVRYCRTLSQ